MFRSPHGLIERGRPGADQFPPQLRNGRRQARLQEYRPLRAPADGNTGVRQGLNPPVIVSVRGLAVRRDCRVGGSLPTPTLGQRRPRSPCGDAPRRRDQRPAWRAASRRSLIGTIALCRSSPPRRAIALGRRTRPRGPVPTTPLPRPRQRRRAIPPPGCGSGPFPLLLTAEGGAGAHDRCRGEPAARALQKQHRGV